MSEKLFAVHVSGPDSILPATCEDQAKSKAKELNEQFAKWECSEGSEFSPLFNATVVFWSGDKESHEQGLLDVDWNDVG